MGLPTRPENKGVPMIPRDFTEKCLRKTNYNKLPDDAKGALLNIMIDVTQVPEIKDYCEDKGYVLSMNLIYGVLRSYCKYAKVQLAKGVKNFVFPNLGLFYKKNHDPALNRDIDGTLKGEDHRKANRKLCINHFNKINTSRLDQIINRKKTQWGLK